MSTISRRDLLLGSMATSVASGIFPCAAKAADPILGRRAAKYKFSLAAYSYRRLLTSEGESSMDLHGFIDECAAMQLEGAELTSYYMPDAPTRDYLVDLRTHCFRQGLAVSGTAIRNDFGHSDDKAREKELSHVQKWVDYASVLHAPMIRVFAGHQKKGISAEQTHELMVDGLTQACAYAGEQGIYLALENHGGPTASAEGLLKLVSDVDSPWLGINLDTGNFREGGDPYQQMEAVARYAVNVQVKVIVQDAEGKPQPMNFERLKSILDQVKYRGFVVLEYEESGDVPAQCRHFVDKMRTSLRS